MSSPERPEHLIAFHHHGEPIPDLSTIEPEGWRAALEPLTEEGRRQACNTAGADVLDARGVAIELALDEADRRAEMAETIERSAVLPAPDATSRSLAGKQVNVRLARADHARLLEAAALMGATPTQLARIFIVNGTRRTLHEHA